MRSPDYQHFVDATGIDPERDLDSAAFAVHRMENPDGPNGPVAYSEVFQGRFDGSRLARYLATIASSQEQYAGHTVYTIPVDGRQLRIAQLGYDTVAASNMPTTEQIHAMLDGYRAAASPFAGSSLLEARYRDVPLLASAWGIGHVGLPFSERGRIQVFGLELPLPEGHHLRRQPALRHRARCTSASSRSPPPAPTPRSRPRRSTTCCTWSRVCSRLPRCQPARATRIPAPAPIPTPKPCAS